MNKQYKQAIVQSFKFLILFISGFLAVITLNFTFEFAKVMLEEGNIFKLISSVLGSIISLWLFSIVFYLITKD